MVKREGEGLGAAGILMKLLVLVRIDDSVSLGRLGHENEKRPLRHGDDLMQLLERVGR